MRNRRGEWARVFCAAILLIPAVTWGTIELEDATGSTVAGVTLRHTAPPDCVPYSSLSVTVSAEPAPSDSLSVTLWFRQLGDQEGFYSRPMERLKLDLFSTSIPARVIGQTGAEYYIEARLGMGIFRAGSAEAPFRVPTAYAYSGAPPDELPGDDFLREIEPRPDATAAVAAPERGSSSWGVQLVVIAVLAAVGYLVYQRISS